MFVDVICILYLFSFCLYLDINSEHLYTNYAWWNFENHKYHVLFLNPDYMYLYIHIDR